MWATAAQQIPTSATISAYRGLWPNPEKSSDAPCVIFPIARISRFRTGRGFGLPIPNQLHVETTIMVVILSNHEDNDQIADLPKQVCAICA
jgi:hypothetical protein